MFLGSRFTDLRLLMFKEHPKSTPLALTDTFENGQNSYIATPLKPVGWGSPSTVFWTCNFAMKDKVCLIIAVRVCDSAPAWYEVHVWIGFTTVRLQAGEF